MERRSSDPVLIQMSQQIGELLGTARAVNENVEIIRDDLHKMKDDHGTRISSLENSRTKVTASAFTISGIISLAVGLVGWVFK